MMKFILTAGLVMLLITCKKENSKELKGIIENRPKILIDKTSQINLNASVVKENYLDTSKHFEHFLCDSLYKFLREAKLKGNYKGLSIAIGIPENGFWHAAIGESGTDKELDVNTKFHALSIGKIFTSAIALKLIELNQLKITDTIYKWFPECPRANEITINNLLNHTSGIQTYECLFEFTCKTKIFSEEELINMAFQYPINENPGTFFSYSNTGYVILGMIMEKVTGLSLSSLFENYFYKPLKLINTYTVSSNTIEMVDIRGYDKNILSSNTKWPSTYAAGPVITTPTDALLIYNYIFNGGFLSDESIMTMLNEMNIWLENPVTYYGKGIYLIKNLPSGNYLGHTGGHDSFKTCIYYNIDYKILISIFSNTNSSEIEPAMFYMAEKLIELMK